MATCRVRQTKGRQQPRDIHDKERVHIYTRQWCARYDNRLIDMGPDNRLRMQATKVQCCEAHRDGATSPISADDLSVHQLRKGLRWDATTYARTIQTRRVPPRTHPTLQQPDKTSSRRLLGEATQHLCGARDDCSVSAKHNLAWRMNLNKVRS